MGDLKIKKTCGGLGRGAGYLLYAIGLCVLLLWLLFPQETVRRTLADGLNRTFPQLRWQVEAVELELPTGLILRTIEGSARREDKKPLLWANVVTVRLNCTESIRTRKLQVDYLMRIGKGFITGFVRSNGGQEGVQVEGTVENVGLTDAPILGRCLGRTLYGSVSGTFSCTLLPVQGNVAGLNARIAVENGRLGLKRPILKHTELPFSQVTVTLHGNSPQLQLTEGTVASELFAGQFSGLITLDTDPALSRLDVQGSMLPTAKFFKGLDNTIALQAFRVELKDNTLPFRLSGDLANPGIQYEGFSVLVQNLEKELE